MSRRDLFSLLVRSTGFLVAAWSVFYLCSGLWRQLINFGATTPLFTILIYVVVPELASLLFGLILIRRADAITRYAYPTRPPHLCPNCDYDLRSQIDAHRARADPHVAFLPRR